MKKIQAALTLLFLLAAPSVCLGKTSRFHDLSGQKIFSNTGTIQFRVKLLNDISADPHNHVLLLGVSSDTAEEYKVEIIQDELIVHRRFGRCVLTSFVYRYPFRPGEWHTLKLTWNGATSRFYADGNEVKKLGLYSSQDLPKMVPGIRLGVEKNFRIEEFRSSGESDVRADPADGEFVKSVVCTDLPQLLGVPPQEEYRGIAFRNFPDRASRDKIKAYVDLLPADFAGAIKNIVVVEDARFLKGGQGGFADPVTRSLVLKGSLYDQPSVFFHEAAHLYDGKLGIASGVPDEKSEWAAISGASCYYKGAKAEEFYKDFLKTGTQNGILGPQGGQCAPEDLAIWVGAVYERYLEHKTLAERLKPGGKKYSEKNIRKMDFILKKGFITQKIYDAVSR
jgi:hypothetical protein